MNVNTPAFKKTDSETGTAKRRILFAITILLFGMTGLVIFRPAIIAGQTPSGKTSDAICPPAAYDSCVDLGNLADEQFHFLSNWGEAGDGLLIPVSGDADAWFQVLRETSLVSLSLADSNTGHRFTIEFEDGLCDDSFEVYIDSQGPIYAYSADPDGYGGMTTHIPIFEELLQSEDVLVAVTNIASDNCGLAKTYNIKMTADDTIASYEYISFPPAKTQYRLYPYPGANIALLVDQADLNYAELNEMVNYIDAAYDFYARTTGRHPYPYAPTLYDGRLTVAVVDSTCGAGCGYLGSTGIEILDTYFYIMYESEGADRYNIPFYELGRNFWFYSGKIAYKANDPVTTGFAVFMREMAEIETGVTTRWPNSYDELLQAYLSDDAYDWYNTLGEGIAPPDPGNLGGSDLVTALLFDIINSFGSSFVETLWQEVDKRPDAQTTQDAVDNFAIALSISASYNLISKIEGEWKWPVSEAAKAEIRAYFDESTPTPTATSTLTPNNTPSSTPTTTPTSTSTATAISTWTPTSTAIATPTGTTSATPTPTATISTTPSVQAPSNQVYLPYANQK